MLPIPRVFNMWMSINEITMTDVCFMVPFSLHQFSASMVFSYLEGWVYCCSV